MGPCFRRDDTRRPRQRPGVPSSPGWPIRPQASHSAQDSIPIWPLNWTKWRRIKRIKRRKTVGVGEILPVRHYDWIAHFGRRTPDKPAVVDLASERRFSYAQFDARIARLAAHLRDRLKIRRGDRVAVLAMNTTDTLEVQFACGRIGAVFLPLNTRLTVPEFQYIVGDAGPTLMIHDAELADVALSVAKLWNVPSLHAGGTVLIMRTFDPGLALSLISDPSRGINVFFGVPSIYQFMAQHPAFASSDFSRLVIGGVGGAPMPVPLLKVWEERGVALQQGYGMTETSPAVLTLDREDAARKAGSSGKPVLHTEVRIVRPDGIDAEVGELGELWVKGPNITPGYWNRPDANQSSFTDGWLHTGDAARIDEEGFYYIVDRWKDMYISGGENVYPAEVENVLHQLAAIAEAAVIGIPSEQWGETGMAIIAVKPGHTLTEAEICAHCEANLARFKRPQLIRFVDAPPRNATGKIHKPTLRKNFGSPKMININHVAS